jgi:hypothetical protein
VVRTHRPRSARFRPGVNVLEGRVVPSFFGAPTFAVGASPGGQAVGDFNGDGRADLVVVNQTSNTMSVLLGNGDGTFLAPVSTVTDTPAITRSPLWGGGVSSIGTADFNGDGRPDFAVSNSGQSVASVTSTASLSSSGAGCSAPARGAAGDRPRCRLVCQALGRRVGIGADNIRAGPPPMLLTSVALIAGPLLVPGPAGGLLPPACGGGGRRQAVPEVPGSTEWFPRPPPRTGPGHGVPNARRRGAALTAASGTGTRGRRDR